MSSNVTSSLYTADAWYTQIWGSLNDIWQRESNKNNVTAKAALYTVECCPGLQPVRVGSHRPTEGLSPHHAPQTEQVLLSGML